MGFILNNYLGSGYTITTIIWMSMGLFIPGDILKAGFAIFIANRLKKHIRSMV